MYPELNLFGYKMGTFPLLVGIGLAVGIFFVFFQLRKFSASPERENAVMISLPLTFVLGTVGAHISDVFFRARLGELVKNPSAYGLTFYGWLISAFVFLILYSKICRISPSYILNMFCPAFAAAQAFGRLGCFFGGCCYGRPFKWGVVYPVGTLPHTQYGAVPLIPVQLYESVYLFAIMAVLLLFVRFKHRAAWYLIMLSAGRFGLEFFRADDRGKFLSDVFSPSQWISIVLFFIGIFLLISIDKKRFAQIKVRLSSLWRPVQQ